MMSGVLVRMNVKEIEKDDGAFIYGEYGPYVSSRGPCSIIYNSVFLFLFPLRFVSLLFLACKQWEWNRACQKKVPAG